MIIFKRISDDRDKFEELLEETVHLLSSDAIAYPSFYIDSTPSALEELVYAKVREASIGTIFENDVHLISGHAFPDIVSDIYGIEVKTAKSKRWRSTGNSILESTRVENVKFVYLLFVKISDKAEFRYRLYQDCLYDIAVTHSPRYLLDMDLKEGDTIFDKMGISYEDLRKRRNPISPVVDYFRSIAKPGEEPWWMETNDPNENIVKPTIQVWSNLSTNDKNTKRLEMIARFPRLFSNSPNKYSAPAAYLAAKYGIINNSFRDTFSAGGQVRLTVGGTEFKFLPRFYQYIYEGFAPIYVLVNSLSPSEAKYYWQLSNLPDESELYPIWKSLVLKNAEPVENQVEFLEKLFAEFESYL